MSDADAAVSVLDRAFVTEAVNEKLANTRSDCIDAPNEDQWAARRHLLQLKVARPTG